MEDHRYKLYSKNVAGAFGRVTMLFKKKIG